MCGITGLISLKSDLINIENECKNMLSCLNHRGPDSDGLWTNQARNICLGHSRLSILDLSVKGQQPMISNDRNMIITYNGEIYNHNDLKNELSLDKLKSSSDTEIILEHINQFGINRSLKKFNGMFSFGIYNRKKKTFIRFSWPSCNLVPAWPGEVDIRSCFEMILANLG